MIGLNLAAGIKAKNRHKAIANNIQRQLPHLYRIARGFVSHGSEAEDLVHDACVKALSSSREMIFETESQFNAWLHRILVNTYRDQYRRLVRSPVRPIDYHATSDENRNVVEMVVSTEPSPAESIHHEQSSSAIHLAFSTLAPEVRVVSVLFLVSGLSYQEIADITDCPIGTVMSRLSRGRQKLKQELAVYHFDPVSGGKQALRGDQK